MFTSKRRTLVPVALVFLIVLNTAAYYWYVTREPDHDVSIYESWNDDNNEIPENLGIVEDTAEKMKLPTGKWADDFVIQHVFGYQQTANDKKARSTYSLIYDDLFARHTPSLVLLLLLMSQRCDLYFSNLFLRNANWMLDPNEDVRHNWKAWKDYRKAKHVKEKYIKDHKLAEKENELNVDNIPGYDDWAQIEYHNEQAMAAVHEQRMHDIAAHVRIFNKCYVTNDDVDEDRALKLLVNDQKTFMGQRTIVEKYQTKQDDRQLRTGKFHGIDVIERKVYPFLSLGFPMYESWKGKSLYRPPRKEDYNFKGSDYDEVWAPSHKALAQGRGAASPTQTKFGKKSLFLNIFKNSLNGRGLVLLIGDKHVNDAVRLIHLLRALDNRFPIEVVYFDNLNAHSKQALVNAAREKMIVPPELYKDLPPQYVKTSDYSHTNERGEVVGLRPQEIWFVNVNNAIAKPYRNKFQGFANKFFATIFNLFSEYLLLDADAVLLHNPRYFFDMEGYKNKGAYFWRDRHYGGRSKLDGYLLDKISPLVVDLVMFNIPILTQQTLQNDYFKGLLYLQELGVVAIDRNRHLGLVIMLAMLNHYGLTNRLSYGDKELFWAGFVVNGDENYTMNKYAAGAVGAITPPQFNLKSDSKPAEQSNYRKSKEVCLPHPGHLSGEDDQVAWINLGFETCLKNVDLEEEFNKGGRFKWITNLEAFKEFYTGPLDIEGIVVPPMIEPGEDHGNEDGEVSGGWHWDTNYCQRYMWCAYSSIGGTKKNGDQVIDNTAVGTVVTVDPQVRRWHRYLGEVYLNV